MYDIFGHFCKLIQKYMDHFDFMLTILCVVHAIKFSNVKIIDVILGGNLTSSLSLQFLFPHSLENQEQLKRCKTDTECKGDLLPAVFSIADQAGQGAACDKCLQSVLFLLLVFSFVLPNVDIKSKVGLIFFCSRSTAS